MTPRWFFLFLISSAVILAGLMVIQRPESVDRSYRSPGLTQPSTHFDDKLFYEGVGQAEEEPYHFLEPIIGGVVPHHLLVSSEIAKFFRALVDQSPQKIILLGPNHEDRGSFGALTTESGWETPFGVVGPDLGTITHLRDRNLVRTDDESLVAEQSVAALVPFIKYYLPETRIVPIVFKSSFTLEEAAALGRVLAELWDETSVLLASVDFSHYLTSPEARRNDEITLRVVSNRNLPELFGLNSDYLDSPQAIGVLLVAMGLLEANQMEILYHSNSGELSGDDLIPTTSYLVLTFRR